MLFNLINRKKIRFFSDLEQISKYAIFHGFLLNLFNLSVFMKFWDKMSRDNALIEQLGTFPSRLSY